MPEDLDGILSVVGMRIPVAKNGINDVSPPCHLEGRKAQYLLVGGLDAFAFDRVVIVHDHGVQAEDDDVGIANAQSPEKEAHEQAAQQSGSEPGKGVEKTSDGVGRHHGGKRRFDGGRVAAVLGHDIEVGQMLAGAVEEKAEHLFEELPDGSAFGVFAHGRKHSIDMLIEFEASEVAREEIEPCSAGQDLVCCLDIIDVTGVLVTATGH